MEIWLPAAAQQRKWSLYEAWRKSV